MKQLTLITLLLVLHGASAQVKGNKEIVKRNFPAQGLTDIEISLYADITIDQQAESGIEIESDANLIDLIDLEVVDGRLKLEQKKWIQPSQRIKVKLGAPSIRRVQIGNNERVRIINLNTATFNAMALNGTLVLEGLVETLNIGAENGTVDAGKLENRNTNVNIWGPGRAILSTSGTLSAELSDEARLILKSKPEKIKGNINKAIENANSKGSQPRYISFKIRNNSRNRHNFYVIGPKPDGNNFSYGFPMLPGKVRKEKWTTGTRVYKVGSLGLRKLLITIEASDEDTVVDLF